MADYVTGTSRNGLPWLRAGDGPDLLVYFPGVNDALADIHHWPLFSHALIKPWSRTQTVYVISRRHGIPAGYTIADMSRDYAKFIRILIDDHQPANNKARVAGVSMGGLCALQFALDYPELTEAIGIHSAAHRPHSQALAIAAKWQNLAQNGRWHELYESLNDITFSGIYRMGFHLFATLLSPWIRRPPANPDDFIHSIEACRHFDLTRQLPAIRKPAQIIAGDRDYLFPAELLRECATGLPDCELQLIAGGGHGVIVDHKRRFDRLFYSFFT